MYDDPHINTAVSERLTRRLEVIGVDDARAAAAFGASSSLLVRVVVKRRLGIMTIGLGRC